MFELKEKRGGNIPEWVINSNHTVQELYRVACKFEKYIEDKLDAGIELKPRDRSIAHSKVAMELGKNPAYINKRDCTALYNHINLTNERLERKAIGVIERLSETGDTVNQLDRLSRYELLQVCRNRGKEIESLHLTLASEAMNKIYDKAMSLNRYGNIGLVKSLQEHNEELLRINAEYMSKMQKQHKEIISAMEEIEKLKLSQNDKSINLRSIK